MEFFPIRYLGLSKFHRPSGIVATGILLWATSNDLLIWWLGSSDTLKFSRMFCSGPILVWGTVTLLSMGLYFFLLEVRTQLRGFILLAVGTWLYAIVFLDVCVSSDWPHLRDVVALMIAWPLITASLIRQVISFRADKRSRDKGTG